MSDLPLCQYPQNGDRIVTIDSATSLHKYCSDRVCVSLCLSVREQISGTTRPIFTNFFVPATYCRGSVFLWHRCDTLCISGLWMTSYLHIIKHICRGADVTLEQPTSLEVQPGG